MIRKKISTKVTETDEVLSAQDLKDQFQNEFDWYLSEQKEVSVEHTSLEILNRAFVAEDLEAITLEELGVTEEEYTKAQATISNPGITQDRRSGNTWAVLFGDMNGGVLLKPSSIKLFFTLGN